MKDIKLGDFSADLEKLVDTRLLIQANSGGGKSFAIRKLIEETHGKVQQIILDIEGDFSSLREKYDFILAGKGGDIAADPKSADLLCRKVLELNSDLIVDLYELKQHDRISFVNNFLEGMINAPKNLWHPVLVVLDEAHIFAPEKGNSHSLGAVIDIATRGRKRGFCIVLATQRLSKLHKDAAAECNNKLIGRTGLDIDLKRAGDELGLKDNSVLRHLQPGDFYAYGPAFISGVNTVHIGEVSTKHPQAGKRGFKHVPQPTRKVKALLKQLEDIPKEAEAEIQDKQSLEKKVKELQIQLKSTPKKEQSKEELKRVTSELRKEFQKTLDKKLDDLRKSINIAINKVTQIQGITSPQSVSTIQIPIIKEKSFVVKKDGDTSLGACERKILGFLKAKFEDNFTKIQVGAMTGYAHSSGGFNNAISRLSQLGFIERAMGRLKITPLGHEVAVDAPDHTLQDWINKLGACEKKIYQHVLDNSHGVFTKENLAQATGYQAGSGGFNNAISRLNTLGLIERNNGWIKLNPEIQL